MTHDEALKLAADRLENMRPLVNDDVDAICAALVHCSGELATTRRERDALKVDTEVDACSYSTYVGRYTHKPATPEERRAMIDVILGNFGAFLEDENDNTLDAMSKWYNDGTEAQP